VRTGKSLSFLLPLLACPILNDKMRRERKIAFLSEKPLKQNYLCKNPCNRQIEVQNFWQQGVQRKWQQDYTTFGNKECRTDIKNNLAYRFFKNCFAVLQPVAFPTQIDHFTLVEQSV
jgi:hypothetical protein